MNELRDTLDKHYLESVNNGNQCVCL